MEEPPAWHAPIPFVVGKSQVAGQAMLSNSAAGSTVGAAALRIKMGGMVRLWDVQETVLTPIRGVDESPNSSLMPASMFRTSLNVTPMFLGMPHGSLSTCACSVVAPSSVRWTDLIHTG